MKVKEHQDLHSFLELVTPYLVLDEAQNNLLLGIIHTLKIRKTTHKLLLTIEDNHKLEGVALQTQGHGLVLSPISKNYIEALVGFLRGNFFPSFVGEKRTCEAVVNAWQVMTHEKFSLAMDQGRIVKDSTN
jgi:hypothetical protein